MCSACILICRNSFPLLTILIFLAIYKAFLSIIQILGPDGKAIKVPPMQQVVVDKHGLPVLGADSKPILVLSGSTLLIPHSDGKCSFSICNSFVGSLESKEMRRL